MAHGIYTSLSVGIDEQIRSLPKLRNFPFPKEEETSKKFTTQSTSK